MSRYKRGTPIGPYRLVRPLSDNGGMAVVYEATVEDNTFLHRHGASVALKIARVNETNSTIFEQLLINETNLLQDLRHPGIVRHYPIPLNHPRPFARAVDLDSHNPPWYFAMEMLRGGTVQELFARGKVEYPIEWKVELIYQIAVILDYIHIRSLAHRDLKPDNIMFRTPPHPKQIPTPVLIDFGLAQKRRLEETVTAATVWYADPERVSSIRDSGSMKNTAIAIRIDHLPSDVWALGVIAYEILTWGKHPFGGGTQKTILEEKILNEAPIPLPSAVPMRLQYLIYDMLHKKRDDRPTISKVIERLDKDIEIIPPRINLE